MPNTNGHGPKKAILYARVSTDEQARSGYSLAQQLEALRVYCEREGYEVLEEVSDPGQSGASLERPGKDRVRDIVAAGGVSGTRSPHPQSLNISSCRTPFWVSKARKHKTGVLPSWGAPLKMSARLPREAILEPSWCCVLDLSR
jgi:predicted site-specific integrase-resolvase